jgi:membrane protease YdiL (CAAX protease family)
VLPTVSSSIGLFFIANVLLAPLVEETLYRGIAIPLLSNHLGVFWAVVLSCVFFGLLHWAGGFWYMLLTGVVAGGAFAGLYSWRGGVLAPFAAHLALNLIEFVYAWHAQP